ncbi:MAG: cadherin domain-containing protein, partial [Candidatus Parabeggiatoa sp.]|nr:cadherin domain-containing protein [Candidatus Parabeggiatoa sp.]
ERTATLTLKTNDPNQSTVTYPLSCLGTGAGPVYASEPEPNTPLTIGGAVVNTTITTELIISEAGNETLEVSEALLSGQHQDDFSLLSGNEIVNGNQQLSIPDGGSAQTLTVNCSPSDIGDRTATLSFSTNDPNQAKVNYPLTCQGLLDEARFTGEIRTQFEAIGNNLTIDSPEKIKLIGRIEPAKQHIGQRANLFFRYQWTPQNGGTTLNIEVTLAEQEPLEEQIEITLFEGWLIGLTGFFKIELGYELPNDELHFDEIATLTIRPNTEPTDLILDGNTVQENSPSKTLIGTFTTLDADKGDWFVYGLIENPNKYFKIKGNELLVSKRLDFETASEYPITVRSVDSNGSYHEKSFIIRVTKAQANPVDIHLTEESVLENTPGNTIIGRFWTEDAEQGNYDYELLEDAEGYFMLDEVENNLLRLAPGKQLDFETEPRHNITVRSTERQIGADIEKTFTIKVINVADMIVQGEIRDILTDILIERPINATESVKFNIQLIPDKAHHGQEADIICMALSLVNEETAAIYVLEGEQWQEWDQNITLPAVMSITLQENHHLALWQGQFTQGQLNLYVAYRLETGELVYSPEAFEITFEE